MIASPAMHVEAEVALKEWAIVCDALQRGRQSLLLRKGGIREATSDRSFHAQHRAFVLMPTYFHAHDAGREHDLVPEVHAELARLLQRSVRPAGQPTGSPDQLRFDLYAEVTAMWQLDAPEQLPRLAPLHVLSDACVTERFNYRRPGLWALHLRVYRLAEPIERPDRPGYAGCVSWVHLDEPVRGAAEPVVSDAEHARREAALVAMLGDAL